MQIASITEIITHFVGLMHLAQDAEQDWQRPDGAGYETSGGYNGDAASGGSQHAGFEDLTSTAGPSTPLRPSADGLMKGWHGQYHPLPPHAPPPVAPISIDQPPFHEPPSGNVDFGGSTIPAAPASVATIETVWTGADQTIVDVHQANILIGDNAYVDHLAGPLPIPDGTIELQILMHKAQMATPAHAPELGHSDSQEVPIFKAFGDGLASGAIDPHHDLKTGTYVDGVFVPDGGAPVPLTLPVTSLSTATPTANDVPLGRTVVTGQDVAGNAALVLDTSAAHSTTIVMGHAVHADLIVQTNVVEEMARIGTLGGGGPASMPLIGGDTATNVAHFSEMPLTLTTSVTGSLGTHWNVQVVNGDFYDVNAVTQTNVLINDTLYAGAPSTDHSYAVLGGNTQLNQFAFTHEAPTYDLLIVLGNSYTANAIYQENVLLNDTNVGVALPDDAGSAAAVSSGHDSVSNEAAIAEYGTTKWGALSPDLQHLVADLVAHGNSAGQFAGLPSTGGTVNVMIVTGDYYNLNLISQTNIVSNNANVLVDFTKAGQDVPVGVHTGADTLTNSAAIVTAGTTAAQYANGGQYETSMLIQSNIVSAHAETTNGSATAFVPELVAFLDTDHAKDVGAAPAASAAPAHTNDAGHHDVVGSLAA